MMELKFNKVLDDWLANNEQADIVLTSDILKLMCDLHRLIKEEFYSLVPSNPLLAHDVLRIQNSYQILHRFEKVITTTITKTIVDDRPF